MALETDSLLNHRRAGELPEEGEQSAGLEVEPTDVGGALGTILETIQEATDTLVDNVEYMKEAAEAVVEQMAPEESPETAAETLLEELHNADNDNVYFLDMALTRNLSILPGEMQLVGEVAAAHAEEQAEHDIEKQDLTASCEITALAVALRPPPSAYILLGSAMIALSSLGPLLQFQQGPSNTLKIVWRQFATSLLLFPFAARSLWKEGLPRLPFQQWLSFLAMICCYATLTVGFATSLEFTAVGNAVILSNSQSVLLLAGKLFVGSSVTPMEGTGALVAFGGAILCSKDSADTAPSGAGGNTLVGDLLACLSAVGGVGYLVLAKPLRPQMNLFVFMYLNMVVGAFLIFAFMKVVIGEVATFDFDRDIGFFGWIQLQMDRLPLELLTVLVCNLVGTLGYVRAMQWFDNIVISVAALLEPVVAEALACLLGVGFLPGWKGCKSGAKVCGRSKVSVAGTNPCCLYSLYAP